MRLTQISYLFNSNSNPSSLFNHLHRHLLSLSPLATAPLPAALPPQPPTQQHTLHYQQQHHQQRKQTGVLFPSAKTQSSQKQQQQRLTSLIRKCGQKSHLLQIHAHLISASLLYDPKISLSLLSRLALPPLQDVNFSRQIFSQIKNPSVLHYNALIRAYSMTDSLPIEGFYLYQEMRRRGLSGDPISLSFVLKCFVRISSLIGGFQVHARILRDGFQSDSLLLTNLMEFYAICKKGDEALMLFDEMSTKDTVAWNVLISCYMRNQRTRDVLNVFHGLASGEFGCEPDDVSCLLVIQACANLGALAYGDKVHSYVKDHGYGGTLKLCNALITMYSRCGCVDKAYGVFKGMRDKNVVTWSAMICGFAMNGHGREAIEAFDEMQRIGVLPDEHTFTGVLSACSHSGFVDEGMLFFGRMNKEFGIVPNVHHYGCIVDLLGRAGHLDRAYEFITSMPTKPDSTIWRTLLGACRIHHSVALGERVVDHLIALKAQEAGDYVLLLNIYSSVGDLERVKKLRRLMKEKGIKTTPGCSSIELKGVVHEFVVDDISHPQMAEIYRMLDEINKKLKIAGYVAEITSELHNLDPEEKGHALSYHSEKLAIAFGIFSTPPGTTIRISKNLRICVDCHNFAKVLSGVYKRKLIIRDRTRFHHFGEGCCSCNDYW